MALGHGLDSPQGFREIHAPAVPVEQVLVRCRSPPDASRNVIGGLEILESAVPRLHFLIEARWNRPRRNQPRLPVWEFYRNRRQIHTSRLPESPPVALEQ